MNNYTLYIDRYSKAYIAGLNSSRGYVLRGDDNDIIVFVDNRYYQRMINSTQGQDNIEVRCTEQEIDAVIEFLQTQGCTTLSIDFTTINHQLANTISQNQIQLINKSEADLRLAKSADELRLIEELAHKTEQVFDQLQSKIKLGQSEREIARVLTELLIDNGFEGEAFPIIVAFGANSSLPHHLPSDKVLENNTNILIDFGGKKGNYNTDLTRNLFIGTPTAEYLQLYQKVYDCQQAIIGGHYQTIDQLQTKAFRVFERTNDRKYYFHNLGHGIGFEVHEYPDLTATNNHLLVDDMTITIEPGLYINKRFGIRIEDMVAVKNGCLRPMTSSPKEVICLILT